jgi:quercetin dioxygenase-like cupin family protein
MTAMPTAVQVVDAQTPGPTLGRHTGFDALAQALVECAGQQPRAVGADEEEVLFVISGRGELELDGERHVLAPEAGAHLLAGERYTLHSAGDETLRLVSVRVPGAAPADDDPREVVVSRLEDQEAQAATTEREFRIVADAASGLRAATHFVGYIPTLRAPEHFHTYDEVIYVLDGVGIIHAHGRAQALGPGSCIQLPARTVHCLENTGDDVMRIVAVFTPSGSPAAAYYPDGTLAYAGTTPVTPAPDLGGAENPPSRRSSK